MSLFNKKLLFVSLMSSLLVSPAVLAAENEEEIAEIKEGAQITFKVKNVSGGKLDDGIGDDKNEIKVSFDLIDLNGKNTRYTTDTLAHLESFMIPVAKGENKAITDQKYSMPANKWNALLKSVDPTGKLDKAIRVSVVEDDPVLDDYLGNKSVTFKDIIGSAQVAVTAEAIDQLLSPLYNDTKGQAKQMTRELAQELKKEFPGTSKLIEKSMDRLDGAGDRLKAELKDSMPCKVDTDKGIIACPDTIIDSNSHASVDYEVSIETVTEAK